MDDAVSPPLQAGKASKANLTAYETKPCFVAPSSYNRLACD